MNRIILQKSDLDGYLSLSDIAAAESINSLYSECLELSGRSDMLDIMVEKQRAIGHRLEEIVADERRIDVYSFEVPAEMKAEASRLTALLRRPDTGHEAFIYYVQRAYEILFSHCYTAKRTARKRPLAQMTPVTEPVQNWAIHMLPDIDDLVHDSVMCVMLRAALLPSMIISKAIEDYSSDGYITPFALFSIKRDENSEGLRYILNPDRSFFSPELLDGKDLIFADPMNATAGSLITIVNYLKSIGVRPRSVKVINIISTLQGALRTVRAIEEADVHTLWMDPVINDKAYILPGLGDAGDRLNGTDEKGRERNILQLIADYGTSIVNLYRNQVREIEKSVLS